MAQHRRVTELTADCDICNIIKKLESLWHLKPTVSNLGTTVAVWLLEDKESGVDVKFNICHSNYVDGAHYFLSHVSALGFPQSLFSSTDFTSQPTTEGTINTVSKLGWLERCLRFHSCGNGDDKPLPTRIVDVGKSNDDLKLVVSGKLRARYTCLSHCWGDHQPLRLTRSTYHRFQDAIPWEELPKTFQEAIAFTRELGIRYLWIDSLTILQDDEADWLAESARMDTVFRNSYLTLAATASRDGTAGLYTKRAERHVFSFSGSHSQFTVSTRATIQHASKWSLSFHFFPLLSRAWVLQERFLSPRVLHFGPHELFWECQDKVCCECGNSRELVLGKRGDISVETPIPETIESLHHEWRDLVEEYSIMQLTKASDKLPALAGLASDMNRRRVNSQYLWGLWIDSLHVDLLWRVFSDREPSASYRHNNWRAPSWSWASIDGDIVWPQSEYQCLRRYGLQKTISFEVSLPSIDPASTNTASDPSTFSLELSGETFKGQLRLGGIGWVSELFDPQEKLLFRTYDEVEGKGLYLDDFEELLEIHSEVDELEVLCMKMGNFVRRGGTTNSDEYALVFVPEDTQKDTFRRIGMGIHTTVHFDDNPSCEEVLEPCCDIASEWRTINVI